MKVFVFAGPTLSAEQARTELDAGTTYLPPAAQGDVYLAALEKPAAIGIIDGYFERIQSVSHKEVLFAMSEGIHVFGAASIGALRAAELATFGMEGVGAVYEAFARGELEDDDEVAVSHAAAEDGYRVVSEAMVNIRATLDAARRRGVLGETTCQALVQLAKARFYPERSFRQLLLDGAREGLAPAELDALQAFLPAGRVDQKRQDALALLRTLSERLAAGLEPKRVLYHFAHTDAWEFILQNARQRAAAT